MKKVLLILLSLALVLSMTGVVAGEHNGATTTYQDKPSGYVADPVKVYLTISEKYTVKIPTEFKFTKSTDPNAYTASAMISGKIELIGMNEHLWINVTSENYDQDKEWVLTSDNRNDLTPEYRYLMDVSESSNIHPLEDLDSDDKSPIKNNGNVLEIPHSDTTEKIRYIHLKIVDNPTFAAEYTDYLTFTINVGLLN